MSALFAILQVTRALTAEPVETVVSDLFRQPPPASHWVGSAPHRFLDGQVVLTCSSHGVFSGGGEPPRVAGRSARVEYRAVFTGELQLNPPLVPSPHTVRLNEPIRMVERMSARGERGGRQEFDTELVAVQFEGGGLPPGIRIRESPRRKSAGNASFARDADGGFRAQGAYRVWLEVSVDGGRRWHLAEQAVGMRLAISRNDARSR